MVLIFIIQLKNGRDAPVDEGPANQPKQSHGCNDASAGTASTGQLTANGTASTGKSTANDGNDDDDDGGKSTA